MYFRTRGVWSRINTVYEHAQLHPWKVTDICSDTESISLVGNKEFTWLNDSQDSEQLKYSSFYANEYANYVAKS